VTHSIPQKMEEADSSKTLISIYQNTQNCSLFTIIAVRNCNIMQTPAIQPTSNINVFLELLCYHFTREHNVRVCNAHLLVRIRMIHDSVLHTAKEFSYVSNRLLIVYSRSR